MKKPLISIIIASYNYEKYITYAIESVLNQTYTNWELIIVDDGSTDNSVEIINKYRRKNSKIKLFQHLDKGNKGLAETIKLGLDNANSEWIAFLDADDTFNSDYLEKKINIIILYPNVNFIFNATNTITDIKEMESHYKIYSKMQEEYLSKKQYPCKLYEIESNKHYDNYISTFSSVMLKKDLLSSVCFCSPVKQYLDHYIWMQIAKKANCYYINEKLTNWFRHNESYITKVQKNTTNILLFNLIMIRYLGLKWKIFPNFYKLITELFVE